MENHTIVDNFLHWNIYVETFLATGTSTDSKYETAQKTKNESEYAIFSIFGFESC
jgi:hypothetical protein